MRDLLRPRLARRCSAAHVSMLVYDPLNDAFRSEAATLPVSALAEPLMEHQDGLLDLAAPFVLISLAIGLGAAVESVCSTPGFGRAVKRALWPFRLSGKDAPETMKARNAYDIRRRKVERSLFETRSEQALSSLFRIVFPSLVAAVAGFLYFDNLSIYLSDTLDADTIRVLAGDNSTGQFVQNFLVVIDLLFAILAGNAYTALYQQQESIYFALYKEVSIAKSLLEQLALVGQARPWYPSALRSFAEYLNDDLRRLDVSPVQRLSAKPVDDPLERILCLTSIGVPSAVYETVRDLRQARGERLGSYQRKFPVLGLSLLYLLAALELFAFPLLGAGTASTSELPEVPTVSILELQSLLFASLCGCLLLVLRIIQELWQSSGCVFYFDDVMQQMVLGLEEELEERSSAVASPGAVTIIDS